MTRQLLSISQLETRITWFEAWVAEALSPSVVASSLANLLAATPAGSAGFIAARLPLVAWAAQPDHADLTHAAWLAAREEGHHQLERFLAARPASSSAKSSEHSQVRQKTKGRTLTLGERKTVARGHQRHVLQRLLVDPDPAVFRLLLANPKVSETDVLRVVSSRTAVEDQLRQVLLSPRWLSCLAVRRALALNPKNTDAAAVPLLWVLRRQDLRDVARGKDLSQKRRHHARELLERCVPVPTYVKKEGLH